MSDYDHIPKFWEINFFQLTVYGWSVMLLALLAAVIGGVLVLLIGFAAFMLFGLDRPSSHFGMSIAVAGIVAACGAGQWVYRFGWVSFRKRGRRLLRDADD